MAPRDAATHTAPIWCVSVHDTHPRGYLEFDLKDVLAALGPRVTEHWWLMTDLDCTGEAAQPLRRAVEATQGKGLVLSGSELVAASQDIFQTIDGTVFALPPSLTATGEAAARKISRADVLYETAPLVIVAVDSSYFDVLTRDEHDVQRLRARFRDVREQDASYYLTVR